MDQPITRIAIVGAGAMARALMQALRDDAAVRVAFVVARETSRENALSLCSACAPYASVVAKLAAEHFAQLNLVVECAGHSAIEAHVLPALAAGVPCVIASMGALHNNTLVGAIERSARAGSTRASFIPGAIAAIDALAAAALGGLTRVEYIGRKPPQSWRGTPAEALCDLDSIVTAHNFFDGSARDAVRDYPKNANVAATVSLAGIGFDATRVRLIADPTIMRNTHQLIAEGAFGRLEMTIENEPLTENPKTSALTVLSLLRAIRNQSLPIAI
ncbi:MAG: aspartate dehydrogenase [Casimicrobium sp.]